MDEEETTGRVLGGDSLLWIGARKIPVLCLHLQGASRLRHVAAGQIGDIARTLSGIKKADGAGRSTGYLRRLRHEDGKHAGGIDSWFLPTPVFKTDWSPDVAKVFTCFGIHVLKKK